MSKSHKILFVYAQVNMYKTMYYENTYNFRIQSLGGEGNDKEVNKTQFYL